MKRIPTEKERKSQERIIELINTECGGSQQMFADRVGIGKSSVSQYVNGRNFPSNIRAGEIAEAFHVDPMWVMGFDYPKRPSAGACSTAKAKAEISAIYDDLTCTGRQKVLDYVRDMAQLYRREE